MRFRTFLGVGRRARHPNKSHCRTRFRTLCCGLRGAPINLIFARSFGRLARRPQSKRFRTFLAGLHGAPIDRIYRTRFRTFLGGAQGAPINRIVVCLAFSCGLHGAPKKVFSRARSFPSIRFPLFSLALSFSPSTSLELSFSFRFASLDLSFSFPFAFLELPLSFPLSFLELSFCVPLAFIFL